MRRTISRPAMKCWGRDRQSATFWPPICTSLRILLSWPRALLFWSGSLTSHELFFTYRCRLRGFHAHQRETVSGKGQGGGMKKMVLFPGCVSRTKRRNSTVAMTSDAGGVSPAASKWHNRGHEPIETPCGVDAGIDARCEGSPWCLPRWRNLHLPDGPCLSEPESSLFRDIFVSRFLTA